MTIPIIISLTSIYHRQKSLLNTLQTCIKQNLNFTNLNNKYYLDKIIINLSVEQYLLDIGFCNKEITNQQLQDFIKNNSNIIEINWVDNTGPYRKLLPTLQKYWDTPKQIIITIDDDITLSEKFVYNIIKEYELNNCEACIAYRGYTMDWSSFKKDIKNIKYYVPKLSPIHIVEKSLYNFSTNGAGTLWTPSMFQINPKSKDLLFNYETILSICTTADDIWYNFMRIINGIELIIIQQKQTRLKMYSIKTDKSTALYYKFNNMKIKDRNTNEELDRNTCQLRNVYNFISYYKF